MCVCVCVCMCVSVMVVVLHPPKPKPPYRPKGGLIGMYVCRRFWGCASSFGRSPKREIGFVSFVCASGRGEAACLRERDYASLRWPSDSRISLLLLLLLLRLWNIVFCIDFIDFLIFLLICAWV